MSPPLRVYGVGTPPFSHFGRRLSGVFSPPETRVPALFTRFPKVAPGKTQSLDHREKKIKGAPNGISPPLGDLI